MGQLSQYINIVSVDRSQADPNIVEVSFHCDPSMYVVGSAEAYGLSFDGRVLRFQGTGTLEILGGGDYKLSFSDFDATDDIVQLLAGQKIFYAQAGFFLVVKVYGATTKPGLEPWFEGVVHIDGLGAHPVGDMTCTGYADYLKILSTDYVARFYTGIPYPGKVGPAALPDWTDVYVDDLYEERNIESGAGSIDNPLYNPIEAIALASQISWAYAVGGVPRKVTVHIASGEYEIMQAKWFFVPGADVEVLGDAGATPFIYANEDFNYYTLSTHGQPQFVFGSLLGVDSGKLRLKDLNFRAFDLKGTWGEVTIENCDFQLSKIDVDVHRTLTLTDNNFSDTQIEFRQAPIIRSSMDSRFLNYIDSDDESTSAYWGILSKVDVTDDLAWQDVLADYTYGVDLPTPSQLISSAGLDPANEYLHRGLNPYRTPMYHPESSMNKMIPVARFDHYTSPWEAVSKNSYFGGFSPDDTVFVVRRNYFRDTTAPIFYAGLGKLYITNNVGTSYMYCSCGPVMDISNNTFNAIAVSETVHAFFADWGGGDIYTAMKNNHNFPLWRTWSPDVLSTSYVALVDNITCTAPEIFAVEQEQTGTLPDVFAGIRSRKFYNNIGSLNLSYYPISLYGYLMASLWKGWWQYFRQKYPTHGFTYSTGVVSSVPSDGLYINLRDPVDSLYNVSSVGLENFEDTVLFFPKGSAMVVIDAGHPDPAYNDPDGSRNDIGAYGGPNSIAYTKAEIRWVESFVGVNYVQLGVGSSVTLDGTYSKRSPKATLTYTWSEDPSNPASVGFVNNGTVDGGVQTITFPLPGTYTYYLQVDDGTTSDQESVSFVVQPPRTYCVDPSKTFANDAIGGVDDVSWSKIDYPGQQPVPLTMETISLDIGQKNALKFDWLVNKTITVAADTRYYLKLMVSQQHRRNVDNELAIGVVVLSEDTGAMLLHDVMFIKGANLINFSRNMQESRTYGVGSCYFRTDPSTTNVTVYIYEYDYDTEKETHLVEAWLAPADEIVDTIYQDARLAIRHHAVGDEVQLAGNSYIDVPIRVAGKKVYFNITGGWDPSSYDGTRYTVQDPVSFPTYLNYLRFAWFLRRQREWTFHAIDMFLPVYFDSKLEHVNVVNLNPDLPLSYDYYGINVYMTQHAEVSFQGLNIKGLMRAGVLRSVTDAYTPHTLTWTNNKIEDCVSGLTVITQNVEFVCDDNTFIRVAEDTLTLFNRNDDRTGVDYAWHRVRRNVFEDCARAELIYQTFSRDDEVYRRMSTYVNASRSFDDITSSKLNDAIYEPDQIYGFGLAPITVISTWMPGANYEIKDNIARTVSADRPSLAFTAVGIQRGVGIYRGGDGAGLALDFSGNTINAGSAILGVYTTRPLATSGPETSGWELVEAFLASRSNGNDPIGDFCTNGPAYSGYRDWKNGKTAVDGIAWCRANPNNSWIVVEGNSMFGCRALFAFGNTAGYYNNGSGSFLTMPFVVSGNTLTDVYSVLYSSGMLILDEWLAKLTGDVHTWIIDGAQGAQKVRHFVWNLPEPQSLDPRFYSALWLYFLVGYMDRESEQNWLLNRPTWEG